MAAEMLAQNVPMVEGDGENVGDWSVAVDLGAIVGRALSSRKVSVRRGINQIAVRCAYRSRAHRARIGCQRNVVVLCEGKVTCITVELTRVCRGKTKKGAECDTLRL